jgi:hypothetical protein
MDLPRHAHIQAVIFAILADNFQFGQIVFAQQLRQGFDKANVTVMRILAHGSLADYSPAFG